VVHYFEIAESSFGFRFMENVIFRGRSKLLRIEIRNRGPIIFRRSFTAMLLIISSECSRVAGIRFISNRGRQLRLTRL